MKNSKGILANTHGEKNSGGGRAERLPPPAEGIII